MKLTSRIRAIMAKNGRWLVALALVPLVSFSAEPNRIRNIPGLSYSHDEVPDVPLSIHIVKVDRTNPEFHLHSMMANGWRIGLVTVSEQIRLLPPALGRPVAGINGDYYDKDAPYTGDPKGLQISQGELLSAPSTWSCMWVDATGEFRTGLVNPQFSVTLPGGPVIPVGLNEKRLSSTAVLYTRAVGSSTHAKGGRELVLERTEGGGSQPLRAGEEFAARVREVREKGDSPLTADSLVLSFGPALLRRLPKTEAGTTLQISLKTLPSLAGATTAIGGGPALVHGGKALPNPSRVQHPRSAVGWNKNFIFFVAVDGRQPRLSVGMTYEQLGVYMAKLGCDEALNFDGGGSAALWVRGQIVNSPSEGKERGVANGLVFTQKPRTLTGGTPSP